jgi:hypothetical protein
MTIDAWLFRLNNWHETELNEHDFSIVFAEAVFLRATIARHERNDVPQI